MSDDFRFRWEKGENYHLWEGQGGLARTSEAAPRDSGWAAYTFNPRPLDCDATLGLYVFTYDYLRLLED